MPDDLGSADPATAVIPRWFPFRSENPQARVRLFGIPQAGAGAAAYLPWARAVPTNVELCAVELPGRARRTAEPPHRRVEPLVWQLRQAVVQLLDLPYLLYGHSMGAVLAFELARSLQEMDVPQPAGLVVSGMVGPARWPIRPPVHHLDTPELLAKAESFLGLPPDIVDDEDMLALLLPQLRADLELTETYRYREGPPLRCPVTVFAGAHDRGAPVSDMRAWGDVTTGGLSLRVFDGGHFFLYERPDVLDALASLLAAATR